MLTDIFREILFPRRCVACGSRDLTGTVCDVCQECIVPNQTLFCGACRARLPDGKKRCHHDFPYILGAATNYENPVIRKLIHALKFRRLRDAATPLADVLTDYVKRLPIDFRSFYVLAVPLSDRRRRERGFNQSDSIAREFAKRYHIARAENILVRTRHTKPQSEIEGVAERRKNMNGAFVVSPGATAPPRIILLDDVTTSGATFLAAATALKAAGVRQIMALAVAKA